MTCVVTRDGYMALDDDKFNVMSITKGVVGLVFLTTHETRGYLDRYIFPNIKITIEEALCHQTGLENDQTFGEQYDEYMRLSEKNTMYKYAMNHFLYDYNKRFRGTTYEYNNIVWRILVQIFAEYANKYMRDAIRSIPGLSDANFDTDAGGFIHGLNGMMMSCKMATDYGKWAAGVLKGHRSILLKYPRIKNHWTGALAGDGFEIHPFFGWFVVASERNPDEPVAAISIGFMSQFICVSLINDVTPGVQLRHPYYEDFGGRDVHRYAEMWISNLLSGCDRC